MLLNDFRVILTQTRLFLTIYQIHLGLRRHAPVVRIGTLRP